MVVYVPGRLNDCQTCFINRFPTLCCRMKPTDQVWWKNLLRSFSSQDFKVTEATVKPSVLPVLSHVHLVTWYLSNVSGASHFSGLDVFAASSCVLITKDK